MDNRENASKQGGEWPSENARSRAARPARPARRGRANIVAGIVIAVVVLVAAGAAAFFFLAPGDANGMHAVVHDGDGGTRELSLSRDSETLIQTSYGKNLVVVKDGAVFVSDADCENHDCMRQGSIDAPGKQIICLPHKLWIEVVAGQDGGSERMDVDVVAR